MKIPYLTGCLPGLNLSDPQMKLPFSGKTDEPVTFSDFLDTSLKGAPESKRSAPAAEALKLKRLVELVQIQMQKALLSADFEENDGPLFSTLPDMLPYTMSSIGPTPQRASIFRRSPSVIDNDPPPGDYAGIIAQASRTYGVDQDLIASVIRAESDFNPQATSPKGAMGLMQLMPETARDLGVKDPYDPQENIMAGARFLKSLLDRYNGNVPQALAAYNWGMGNVERHPESMPRETREYISRITHYMRQA